MINSEKEVDATMHAIGDLVSHLRTIRKTYPPKVYRLASGAPLHALQDCMRDVLEYLGRPQEETSEGPTEAS